MLFFIIVVVVDNFNFKNLGIYVVAAIVLDVMIESLGEFFVAVFFWYWEVVGFFFSFFLAWVYFFCLGFSSVVKGIGWLLG